MAGISILAYVLWKMMAQLGQRAGLGNESPRVFEELSKIQVVDIVLPTRDGVKIRRRCITRPTSCSAWAFYCPNRSKRRRCSKVFGQIFVEN